MNSGRRRTGSSRIRLGVHLFLASAVLAGQSGCTRTFYRKAADAEVNDVLAEKNKYPAWGLEQYHVYPDPRSRFADPTDPDHTPQPNDDIAAYKLAPRPQQPGKEGVAIVQGTGYLEMMKSWDESNRAARKAAEEKEAAQEKKEAEEIEKGAREGDGGKGSREEEKGKGSGEGDKGKGPEVLPAPRPLGKVPDDGLPAHAAVVVHTAEKPTGVVQAVARQGQGGVVQAEAQDDSGKGGKDEGPGSKVEGKNPASSLLSDNSKRPIQTYFDEPLNAKESGFLLTLDQSVELGVINSFTYQGFREQLYEAALPVTLERFSFAYQFAASEDFIRDWAGKLAPGLSETNGLTTIPQNAAGGNVVSEPAGERNNWQANGNLSFSKLFSTGALLTFDFANTTLWNFLSPKMTNSTSTINLSAVQPLLQGGGRAVTLEPLTQAERTLLYSIRAYARFREQFYVNIAQGNSTPSSLSAAVGSNVSNPISVLAALGIASTDVSGGFVSYLSTLYRECDLACDKKLVRELEKALRIYEGYQEGGQFSPLQVDQVRSTLLQGRNTVLTDQQFVNNALDQFKQLLGIPANIPLILDDALAQPITEQLDRYYAIISDSDDAGKLLDQQENTPPGELRAFVKRLLTQDRLVRRTEFQKKFAERFRAWERASEKEMDERQNKLRDERRKLLDRKTEVELKGGSLTDAESKRLREMEIESDLGSLEGVLRRYEGKPWEKEKRPEARQADRVKLFRLVAYSIEIVLVWPRNERFDAVTNLWAPLPKAPLDDLDLSTAEVGLAQQKAVQHALNNRWDLMNVRAEVVDSWRQLRVTANALLGVVNVQYNLTATTPPTGIHPFDFSYARTQQTLGLDVELPLNRVAQRNAYRTAQINYQAARRALIAQEDNIAVQVRFDVRELQLFAANYKIQKQVIKSLYSQVESALEVITAPADPAALQASGTTGQANAAALTSQYLSALSSLNNAQTRMYDIWLSYLATRMQLYLDVESLRMDNRGVWLMQASADPADATKAGDTAGKAQGSAAPATLPAPLAPAQAAPLPEAALPAPLPLPLPLPLLNGGQKVQAAAVPPRVGAAIKPEENVSLPLPVSHAADGIEPTP